MSTHPAPVAASAAKAASRGARNESVNLISASEQGLRRSRTEERSGSASVGQLAADVGLDDREVGIENHEVRHGFSRQHPMPDEAEFPGRSRRAHHRGINEG